MYLFVLFLVIKGETLWRYNDENENKDVIYEEGNFLKQKWLSSQFHFEVNLNPRLLSALSWYSLVSSHVPFRYFY